MVAALAGVKRMPKSKSRTYRVFTCKKCCGKYSWRVRDLVEVGLGQCHFCGTVTRELYETPLLVTETKSKRRKAS